MPIHVVCPGCRKGFQVSEKFAGKSGPCPQCKTVIQVPSQAQEVQVHAPEEFSRGGGRNAAGVLVGKPIARAQVKIEPVAVVAVLAGVLAVVVVAWAAGSLIQGNLAIRVAGLLVVSPPLVVAAYSFLRNDELEPHRGRSLYVRAAVCSLAYMALWWVYGYLAGIFLHGELWEWLLVVPPVLALGALGALVCLDLEYGNGFFHYAFYVLATVLLRSIAGMGWPWDVVPPGGP